MMFHPKLALFATFLAASIANASAAVVLPTGTLVGVGGNDNDEIDRWRTTSVIKTFDPDGDNVYGTAGYVLYGTDSASNSNNGTVVTADPLGHASTLSLIPSYLTLSNAGQNKIATSYGYRLIDDPTQTPGPAVSNVETGAALRDSALGLEQSMLTFTIGANFPAQGLRLGFFTNNADSFAGSLRLTQTVGGSASASLNLSVLPAGQELALHFFDIIGAVPGDVFTVYLQKTNPQPAGGNVNTNVLYGGVTMDVIPEPGSAALLATAIVGLVCRRRRSC